MNTCDYSDVGASLEITVKFNDVSDEPVRAIQHPTKTELDRLFSVVTDLADFAYERGLDDISECFEDVLDLLLARERAPGAEGDDSAQFKTCRTECTGLAAYHRLGLHVPVRQPVAHRQPSK